MSSWAGRLGDGGGCLAKSFLPFLLHQIIIIIISSNGMLESLLMKAGLLWLFAQVSTLQVSPDHGREEQGRFTGPVGFAAWTRESAHLLQEVTVSETPPRSLS